MIVDTITIINLSGGNLFNLYQALVHYTFVNLTFEEMTILSVLSL